MSDTLLNQQRVGLSTETSIADLLVGTSRAILQVRELVTHAAQSDVNVLILGASGSGKEIIAKSLHYLSKRKSFQFIPVNCGAIPSDLLESELFGHEKGAFTGAYSARKGRFELANKGSIFLDEIGDMPFTMQVKLLRVLQERCFEKIGSNKLIETDVRIIAATHCNLEQAILEKKFREDLYYRLNVFPIEMPSLKQRIEDLPLLIDDLVENLSVRQGGTISFSEKAIQILAEYDWPGNVRELSNLVERLIVLYPNTHIDAYHLPNKYYGNTALDSEQSSSRPLWKDLDMTMKEGIDLKKYLTEIELSYIKHALKMCDGVVVNAAKYLKIRRTTLIEKMRKYGICRIETQAFIE